MPVPAVSPPAALRPATAERAAALLAAHVPLSLLLDLAEPAGPRSRDLLDAEPGTADWLTGRC